MASGAAGAPLQNWGAGDRDEDLGGFLWLLLSQRVALGAPCGVGDIAMRGHELPLPWLCPISRLPVSSEVFSS